MSKKISDVYNENPAAGDDTSMVSYFPAEAADGTPVAYSDEQLMALAETRLHIDDLQTQISFLTDAIADIPWQPPTVDSGQFTATINAGSLNVLVTGSINFDSDRYVAMTDDDSTPTGAVGAVYTWTANTLKSFQITLANWNPVTLRIWARRTVDSVWIMLDPNPSNGETPAGLTLIPIATAPPVFSGSLVISSNTATTVTGTAVPATIIDGVTVQIDLVNTYNSNNVLKSNITDFDTDALIVTGLTPEQVYGFALLAYPAALGPAGQRTAISNVVEVTMDAASEELSFSAFTVSEEADSLIVTIESFTASGASNLEFGWSLDGSVPTSWVDAPIPLDPGVNDEIDFTSYGYGDYTLTPWIRDADDTTNVLAGTPVSFTLESTGVYDIYSIDATNSTTEVPDYRMEPGTIRVIRSNKSANARTIRLTLSDGASSGIDAVAGFNYQPLDTPVYFAVGEDTVDVPIEPIARNLAHTDMVPAKRWLTASLSLDGESGSLSASASTLAIAIVGTNGYMPDGALDLNRLPTDLTRMTGMRSLNAASQTYDRILFDGELLVDSAFNIQGLADNTTFKRCVFRNFNGNILEFYGAVENFTVKNCYADRWAMRWKEYGRIEPNCFLRCYPSAMGGDNSSSANMTVKGSKFIGHGRVWLSMYTNGAGFTFLNNYFKNTTNEDLGGMTRTEYVDAYWSGTSWDWLRGMRDGTMIMQWYNRDGTGIVRGNVALCKRFGTQGGHAMDIYNYGDQQATTEGRRNYFEFNSAWGSTDNHIGSAMGVITDTVSQYDTATATWTTYGGYLTCQHNTMIETQNGGCSVGDGKYLKARWNDFYCGLNSLEHNINGVGLTPGSINADLSGYVNYPNRIKWYGWDATNEMPRISDRYSSGAEPAGYWSQNLIMDGTGGRENWITEGETLVKGRKALLNRAGFDSGIYTQYASYACPVGVGMLRWDNTAKELFFAPWGESEYSDGVVINTSAQDSTWGDYPDAYTITGDNPAHYIRIAVNPVAMALLSSDMAWKVKVSPFLLLDENFMVQAHDQDSNPPNYIDGEWGGDDEVTVPVSSAPAVPTGLNISASDETSVTLAWNDMSVTSYRVYRRESGSEIDTLIGSPTNYGWVDTTLTPGITYEWRVASANSDVPPLLSSKSAPVSGSTTTTLPGALPDLDDPAWNLQNGTLTDLGDGTWELVGTSPTGAACLWIDAEDVLADDVNNLFTFPVQCGTGSGYQAGRVCAKWGVQGVYFWTGNLIYGMDFGVNTTLTEVETLKGYTGSQFDCTICIWINATGVGTKIRLGVPRINPES